VGHGTPGEQRGCERNGRFSKTETTNLDAAPGELAPGSRFFLSEYLTWRTQAKASAFAEAFARFARERRVFGNV
jgi:hypothetical protein